MKKFFLVVLVVVLLLVLAIVFGIAATSGLPKAADAFFDLIAQGRMEEAYRSTAREFQAATSQSDFERYLESTALTDYQSASWSSRTIENKVGKLEGSVTTRDGGRIPIVMDFVKENNEWKVLSLIKATAGLVDPAAKAEPPSGEALHRLTGQAILLLAEAINANDFSDFHKGISRLWESQSSAEALREAFMPFIEMEIDLTPLKSVEPVFSKPPAVGEDDILLLEGYYSVDPYPVYFSLKYIYEHPQWKLMGINVRM